MVRDNNRLILQCTDIVLTGGSLVHICVGVHHSQEEHKRKMDGVYQSVLRMNNKYFQNNEKSKPKIP